MSKKLTEAKLLKQLDIPDFRHMTKDKMMAFASSIHKMDPEVAKAAIAQFPNFKELATSSIQDGMNIIKELVNSDKEEQVKIYNSFESEQATYLEMLNDENMTFEQKLIIMDQLKSIRDTILELNRESKMFKLKMGVLTIAGVVTVLLGSASLLGGNSTAEIDSDD